MYWGQCSAPTAVLREVLQLTMNSCQRTLNPWQQTIQLLTLLAADVNNGLFMYGKYADNWRQLTAIDLCECLLTHRKQLTADSDSSSKSLAINAWQITDDHSDILTKSCVNNDKPVWYRWNYYPLDVSSVFVWKLCLWVRRSASSSFYQPFHFFLILNWKTTEEKLQELGTSAFLDSWTMARFYGWNTWNLLLETCWTPINPLSPVSD